MTDDNNQGVTAPEQPAAPSEQAQIVVDETAAVNSDQPEAPQITESVVASEPAAAEEPEVIEGKEFGDDDDTRIPLDKKAARKYYFQVQQMGGEPVFNATREIAAELVSASTDPVRLANKIHDLNPDAYQQLGSVLLDATIKQQFGEGVTFERIAQALQRPAEQPTEPQPNGDEPTDDYVSPAVEAKLKRLEELERRFPELETKVGKFDEIQQARTQEQIQQFGQTIITEAMSPLAKLFEDAGLKILSDDSPEEIEAKTEIAQAVQERAYYKVLNDPNNKAIVDETQMGIETQNGLLARKHMLKLQARIEKEAARQIQIFTGRRAQARNLQTKPLTNETARTVPGNSGAAAFAQTADTTEPFNPDRAHQVLQDIVSRSN